MGWRNNKRCDQKGQDPNGVRQAKKNTKKIPPWVKKPFQICMAGKRKQQLNLNY